MPVNTSYNIYSNTDERCETLQNLIMYKLVLVIFVHIVVYMVQHWCVVCALPYRAKFDDEKL